MEKVFKKLTEFQKREEKLRKEREALRIIVAIGGMRLDLIERGKFLTQVVDARGATRPVQFSLALADRGRTGFLL